MNTQATECGDYDIKAKDLHQLYAGYGAKPMNDDLVSVLAFATIEQPDNSIGDKVWLRLISGTSAFDSQICQWARELAHAIATSKPVRKKHGSRWLITSYSPTWGDSAAYDGVQWALCGTRPTAQGQSERLGCDRNAYTKLRNIVAGAVLLQAEQFEHLMRWSINYHRNER
jgi:hypothetical protein